MATATLPIPQTHLPLGPISFGPLTVTQVPTFTLSIDRTVSGGLNATPAAVVVMEIDSSTDGGVTWRELSSDTILGGILHDDQGNQVNTTVITAAWGAPITANRVRIVGSVTGAAVTIGAGSLVIQ